MISDMERRDIAEGLRGLKGEHVPIAYVLDELGVDCDGADVPKADVARLADLIDRPTCRIWPDVEDEGTIWDLFGTCTCCGAVVDAYSATATASGFLPTRYCPACGAKVVG
nr:MAG TPA: Transcription initiation factor IIE, alpha FINGER, Transcription [Caudoviricetes sp.]